MEIFDLPGPEFLSFYIPFLLLAVAAALVLRWKLRDPGGDPRQLPSLGPYESACLAEGPVGAISAAVASLMYRGTIVFKASGRELKVNGSLPVNAEPLEDAVYEAVATAGQSTLRAVRRATVAATRKLTGHLEDQQLLLSAFGQRLVRVVPPLLVAFVLFIGLIKLIVGIGRSRPIGYLMLTLAVGLIVLIIMLARHPLRTRRGDRVLARLKRENAALQVTAVSNPDSLHPSDLVTALALFGPETLVHSGLASLAAVLMEERRRNALHGGYTSSGCGAGGCGGCGGD
jgi:uncharacterized protein (TIGR04222 family)